MIPEVSVYVVNGRGRLARLDIPDMGDTWDSVSSAFPTFFDMVPSASVLGCSLSEHDPTVDGVFTPGMEPELVEWFQEASRWPNIRSSERSPTDRRWHGSPVPSATSAERCPSIPSC